MKVFTNGCFDILHPGHIDLLTRAKAMGDRLIVGINSDASTKAIKGVGRPLMTQDERRSVLMGLKTVDEVVIFDELTPERLIREVEPDILVKGGDWKPEEIVGADFVLSRGGKVYSLPLLDGYSTTSIIERSQPSSDPLNSETGNLPSFDEHVDVIVRTGRECAESIDECARILIDTIRRGSKVLLCGNGGSAADAQHIAAEFVGRYEAEREGLAAIALTTDTSALTALANDYSFERIFARQVEALAREGDCLIAISTSGNSPNVIAAAMAARKAGCRVIGMTGGGGKKLAGLSDACLKIPSQRTSRIQEAHITVAHIWCEMIDSALAGY
jgi:D-sedoheptulose 7-phosphate isomerase